MTFFFSFFLIVLIIPKETTGRIKEEGVDMMLMIGAVAGGFLVLIVAIVIVCISMRNIQRNSAKKAAENAERLAKNANTDTVSSYVLLYISCLRRIDSTHLSS